MQFKPEKKLGFGLMRLPLLDKTDSASIDLEQAKKMVDLFIERGFTYFDTAWMYHSFASESAAKEILTSRYP
ncbi:MAG: aldo/keto reductase, partial [Erysipelotrichaceae bacterium]|nr:aldo/keto reductase [Erysipelotrichaceae bacterium]